MTLVACAWLAGCAGLAGQQEAGPPFRDPAMSMERANSIVFTGKTTQAEVLATLGPATSHVTFDSGSAVWVYREKSRSPPSARELVLLFTPGGVLHKTRLRTPPSSAEAQPGSD